MHRINVYYVDDYLNLQILYLFGDYQCQNTNGMSAADMSMSAAINAGILRGNAQGGECLPVKIMQMG